VRLRRLVAAAAVAGTAAALAPASPAFATSAIRLGRIQYDSPGTDTRSNTSLNAEWVTIRNTGTHRVNLRGWTLRDTSSHVYTFGTTYYLRAGTSVRIHTGSGTNTATNRYWGRRAYVWNNDGDTAILRNASGTGIDRCTWGDGSGVTSC
jgi:hypothetical protein